MALTNPKVKSVFSLHIGGTDYVSDITAFRLFSEELPKERITFSKYTTGTAVKWTLEVDAVYDGGSEGSLHDYIWQNAGTTAQFIIKPFQSFDPLTKRFYQGSVRMNFKPDTKLKAGETSTFTYKFKVIGQPIRSDQPSGFLTAGYYDEY